MEHNDERPGWVRLPGYIPQDPAPPGRADGVRRVRRTANWTAAALIAGVAATTGYFAHHMPPAATTTAQVSQARPGVPAAAAGTSTAAGPHKASGSAPMVISGGSGVAVGSAAGAGGTAAGPGGARSIVWRDN